MALCGLFGRPFVALDELLDLRALDDVHEEVCLALAQVPVDYTGGSHRSMRITPPSREAECLVDYGEVVRAMNDAELATLRSLADDPRALDPASFERVRRGEIELGEERDVPLSRRQMLWLKARYGVYFPWKAYVELIPNARWSDKSTAAGKRFTRQARAFFPKTIALAASLPFVEIGRCNVMGLEAHDHGTVHRDGEPDEQRSPDHFITLCPAANKRVFLWDEGALEKTHVAGRAYWFNDFDYHGVDADPFFRYSIRVDGVFQPEFLARVERACAADP